MGVDNHSLQSCLKGSLSVVWLDSARWSLVGVSIVSGRLTSTLGAPLELSRVVPKHVVHKFSQCSVFPVGPAFHMRGAQVPKSMTRLGRNGPVVTGCMAMVLRGQWLWHSWPVVGAIWKAAATGQAAREGVVQVWSNSGGSTRCGSRGWASALPGSMT